jgi:alkanesulfonate monooxygenase SsuD/methylene tetrahydromethanopterin reductase-like flavin-dependent oxidoreductase (luciferase family)
MDHFYQLPMLGSPDQPMLESYTALGALATATERVQLGTLVTGNTYRNPTLLAKAITTLDVVSAGRAILGIGTGWFELEHRQLGFEFGTFTDRFKRLEEALQILDPMIKGEPSTFSGDWYTTESAIANPRYRDPHPDTDRRPRREEDVLDRRALRRPPQHHRRIRRAAGQARRAGQAVRRGRA